MDTHRHWDSETGFYPYGNEARLSFPEAANISSGISRSRSTDESELPLAQVMEDLMSGDSIRDSFSCSDDEEAALERANGLHASDLPTPGHLQHSQTVPPNFMNKQSISLPLMQELEQTQILNQKLITRKPLPTASNADPDLVTWDHALDPDNPHNWPRHRKWTSMILIAAFAFISPMASTIVAPALDDIAEEFSISARSTEEFLVMSIFLLAFAIGPFVWGPLSEVFGRTRVMQGANLIFLIFNTVCGFARSKEQMMAFRFLSGIGGSAPQAVSLP